MYNFWLLKSTSTTWKFWLIYKVFRENCHSLSTITTKNLQNLHLHLALLVYNLQPKYGPNLQSTIRYHTPHPHIIRQLSVLLFWDKFIRKSAIDFACWLKLWKAYYDGFLMLLFPLIAGKLSGTFEIIYSTVAKSVHQELILRLHTIGTQNVPATNVIEC